MNTTNHDHNKSTDQPVSHSNGPINLSPEDRSILKSLQQEAAIKRGYPLAILATGGAYFVMAKKFPNMSIFGKISFLTVAGITGNLIGKISYFPTALQRLETDLSPDSPLRQFMEKRKNDLGSPFFRQDSAFSGQQDTRSPAYGEKFSVENQQNINAQIEQETSQANDMQTNPKTNTYAEMRRRHREKERNIGQDSYPPLSNEISPSQNHEDYSSTSVRSNVKVRYNKYGDPILE